MRIELRDGQWAELRERITHAQDKEIKRASLRSRDDPTLFPDAMTVLVRTFVRSWNVSDPDGNPIPLTDADAIDRAPDDIVDELFDAAQTSYKAATVPNPSTPPSSDDS